MMRVHGRAVRVYSTLADQLSVHVPQKIAASSCVDIALSMMFALTVVFVCVHRVIID